MRDGPAATWLAIGCRCDRAWPPCACYLPGPPGRRRVRHRRRSHRYGQCARGRLEAAVRRVPGAARGGRAGAVPAVHPGRLPSLRGRPRYDGVGGFLGSRGIDLPWGDPRDPPDRETVCGLGNAKDRYFLDYLRDHGAQAFPSSAAFLRRLRAEGLRTAAVSASRNMIAVLESAGPRGLFDVEGDGVRAEPLQLGGQP